MKILKIILKWLFGLGMIVWSIFYAFMTFLISMFATDAGTPQITTIAGIIWTLMLVSCIVVPLLNIAGTILGNIKSYKFYYLYIPSVAIPFIFLVFAFFQSF